MAKLKSSPSHLLAIAVLVTAAAILLQLLSAGFAQASGEWSQYKHDAARTARNDSVTGPVQPKMVRGWPVKCVCYKPVVAEVDVNGRRTKAVFAVNPFGIYAFKLNGQPLPGAWPVRLPVIPFVPGSPAIADDNGATKAFFTTPGEFGLGGAPRRTEIFGMDSLGALLPGWAPWSPASLGTTRDSPAIATDPATRAKSLYISVDGEGVTYSLPSKLYALDLNGSVRPGWPVTIDRPVVGFPLGSSSTAVSEQESAIYVDTYNFSPSRYSIEAFDMTTGAPKPGWPFKLPQGGQQGSRRGPTIKGRSQIRYHGPSVNDSGTVYASSSWYTANFTPVVMSSLYAIHPSGSVVSGWPVPIRGMVVATAIDSNGGIYVAVYKEIRDDTNYPNGTATTYIYAFRPDGSLKPGWPVKVYRMRTGGQGWGFPSELAVDKDDNVYFGLARPRQGDPVLHAYTPAGRRLPGWPPRPRGLISAQMPALGDDGTLYFYAARRLNSYPWVEPQLIAIK